MDTRIRLSILEERLTVLTLRVDAVTKDTLALINKMDALFNSDGKRPGIFGRLIALEDFIKTTKWMVGVLYAALVGLVFKLLF